MKNDFEEFDEDQYDLSRYKWVIPMFVIVSICSILMVKCSSNNLEGHIESSSIVDNEFSTQTKKPKEEKKVDVATYTYKDTDNNFTIKIPEEWLKVNGEDHNVSFVDRNTGSKLDLTITDYYPQINSITADTMTQQAGNNGMQLQEFKKQGNNSYSLSYNNQEYGFIEYTHWDLSKVITLSFTVKIDNFNNEDMSALIKTIGKSFKWKQSSPIPKDLTMVYNDFGSFEIGLITDWVVGSSDNTIRITNQDGSAAISVTVNESNASLDGISQVDYTNLLAQSKENFMMKSFTNDGQKLSCVGSYTINDKNIDLQQYIFCNGQYEYVLSFDTEEQITSDLSEVQQEIVNSFRIFS